MNVKNELIKLHMVVRLFVLNHCLVLALEHIFLWSQMAWAEQIGFNPVPCFARIPSESQSTS